MPSHHRQPSGHCAHYTVNDTHHTSDGWCVLLDLAYHARRFMSTCVLNVPSITHIEERNSSRPQSRRRRSQRRASAATTTIRRVVVCTLRGSCKLAAGCPTLTIRRVSVGASCCVAEAQQCCRAGHSKGLRGRTATAAVDPAERLTSTTYYTPLMRPTYGPQINDTDCVSTMVLIQRMGPKSTTPTAYR